MSVSTTRRSERIELALEIEVQGTDIDGREFSESAETMTISRYGGAFTLSRQLAPEQELFVRPRSVAGDGGGRVRVVGQISGPGDRYAYCVALVDAGENLWGVEFPPSVEPQETLARMLLECVYCRTSEIVHVNEMELEVFEAHQGIARFCKRCGAPTIWAQPKPPEPGRTVRPPAAAVNSAAPAVDSSEGRKPRLKTRLSGCVRLLGMPDEIVVCENISRGGLCFRSRVRYAEGAGIEIAVPYTKGTANIFVPARIVYTQEIPAARLFRHGVAFKKVEPQA